MAQSIAHSAPGDADFSRMAVVLFSIAQVAAAGMQGLGIGTPIGEQSDAVRTLVTPAGWGFSIWGALYVGAFAFAIYQALPAQRDNRFLEGLRWPAAGGFLGNALWAAYVQLFDLNIVSVAIILVSLGSMLLAFRRIAAWQGRLSVGDRWCAVVSLSALAAWLTAATIVNVAASLRFHGVEADAAAAPLISAGVIVAGGIIAGLALARSNGSLPYALVFLWALAAIFAAGGQASRWVALATVVAAFATLGGVVIGLRGEGHVRRFRNGP